MIAKRILPLALLTVLSAVACGSSPASENVGQKGDAIIAGKASTKAQDSVVFIRFIDFDTGEFGACSGTLLAPNLVLTARHCVAQTDEAAACDSDGTPFQAGVVYGNRKAANLTVFVGTELPDILNPKVKPAGTGLKILDDGGKNLCNHDIALILLAEPIADAPIAPLRLDSSVEKGDIITAVGWGLTETSSHTPSTRQQRTGVKVTDVGPDDTGFPVPPNEFEVGESICSGDSGGPAFASTGAIVGVVSRGGSGSGGQNPNDPAAGCIGGQNFYTKVSPFKDFIMKGFELAEAEPWIEGGPDPRLLKPGVACDDGTQCRSTFCLADPSQSNATTCAQSCADPDSTCPDGEKCIVVDEAKVCRAPGGGNGAKDSGGMCSGSPLPATGSGYFFALAALMLAVVRRKKH